MFKTILKELLKWLIMTLIIGSIVWFASSLYKFIKNRVRGH